MVKDGGGEGKEENRAGEGEISNDPSNQLLPFILPQSGPNSQNATRPFVAHNERPAHQWPYNRALAIQSTRQVKEVKSVFGRKPIMRPNCVAFPAHPTTPPLHRPAPWVHHQHACGSIDSRNSPHRLPL